MAAIALCYAGLCCEGLDRNLRRASRLLARELERQILADGGHASRNPRIVVDLLFDLLPLRQMFASREVDTPEALLHAIDRMLPMVRLFRHGDGTLSHFNGMGVTAADHLATLLTYDDMRSQPIQHAPHSGYERLEAGRTLLVADVGAPPPRPLSQNAGAGCLSFEFSSAAQRIVVNCGTPLYRGRCDHPGLALDGGAFHRLHRRRLVLPDRRQEGQLAAAQDLGLAPAPGRPRRPQRRRSGWRRSAASASTRRSSAPAMTATSRASASPMSGAGSSRPRATCWTARTISWTEGGRAGTAQAIIRFHLAPGIKASRAQGGRVVMLVLPNREAWQFSAAPTEAQLEDSIFLATADGMRRTEQIVLTIRPSETPVGALAF